MNCHKHPNRGPLYWLSAILIASLASAQPASSVTNNDHRPLAGALDKLEAALGIVVNYEDPPYENIADLEDVSTPEQRAKAPGFRILVPRKGEISATVAGSSDSDKMFSIIGLFNSYRNAGLPGDFTVEQANGAYYVLPTKILSTNGSFRDVGSPLKTLITLPNGERRAADAENEILKAVSKAAGINIVFGSFPFRPTTLVTLGADREPARDVLARFFGKLTAAPVSYRLLYDANLRDYMLNVQVRAVPEAPPVAPESPIQTPSPFFKKEKP